MLKRTKRVKKEKQEKVSAFLKQCSQMPQEEILQKYQVTLKGYNEVEAQERYETYGPNYIQIQKEKNIVKRIEEAIINPFNIVLIVIAIVTFITDIVIAKKPSYETFLLIMITIFVSALISFMQQEKSNQAAKRLQKMVHNHVEVVRHGKVEMVDMEKVVPGDIVKLSSGDMLPGDVRFLQVKDLFVDQASLTGESNPVEKFVNANIQDVSLQLDNIGYMGTNIISGTATAIVLSTGNQTYFGNMAKSLSTDKQKSSFEKGIDSVSKLLIRFMLIMVPIIFVINVFTKDSWVESLLFGITIAVGLTPEMLPVIMTSTLAKGAVTMSKKKTIVKRLGAIQAFGEMDILCTDKTGTLTQDKIVLEKYMNAIGEEEDHRVLKHAFLNSYFQTGLKNLIDVAIINRAEKEKMDFLKGKYKREDEIPFDFSRRRMSVVLRDEQGKRQLITKGAVVEMLSICSFIEINGQVVPIDISLKQQAMHIYEKYNQEGLRVLAIAQKNEIHAVEEFGIHDEKDMVLIGFIGFLDPPKESAKTAIAALRQHGVRTVVLTGDSEGVAVHVCEKVDINTENRVTGAQIEAMTDEELKEVCEKCNLFSKLSPFQKQRIVNLYQENGHTVGYMGDGINDSPPLKASDVGISVDTAVDIAKETADIILLEKDLNVLEEGVIEGRKTFANISKYIKMATSGNFGNMLSVMIASICLPFLPLLPLHILIQNLLCDFAQLGMPFDHVDEEYILKPKKWETKSIKRFMFSLGTISSILDVACFAVLWFVFQFNNIEKESLFQNGWFIFGIISQTLIIHMIRTNKIPFIQSKASKQLTISTLAITIIALIIGFTNLSTIFDLATLPITYFLWLSILMVAYACIIQLYKTIYIKKYKEWL